MESESVKQTQYSESLSDENDSTTNELEHTDSDSIENPNPNPNPNPNSEKHEAEHRDTSEELLVKSPGVRENVKLMIKAVEELRNAYEDLDDVVKMRVPDGDGQIESMICEAQKLEKQVEIAEAKVKAKESESGNCHD